MNMKQRSIVLAVIGVFMAVSVQAKPIIPRTHKDSVNVLKQIIMESDAVTGSSVGFAGSISNTWYAFAWLVNIATAKELIEMTESKSAVLRVYAYSGLLYRRYKPAPYVIKRLSEDTTAVKTFSGCIMGTTTVADAIVNNSIWYNREGMQEAWKNIQSDKRYRKEVFNALVNHKPIKRYMGK
jgi:hypothetical protein